ncbi:MAG: Ldh family oxidoreductase [Lachnospiraceae bacterium]|nr:Ldh family oxidoreductase [Lachnospiraceae bacterium]
MKYPVEQIRDFCEKVWVKAGLSEEDAKACVDVLLAADIRGQRTHGTTHMKDYCTRMQLGTARNGDAVEIKKTAEATLTVDANHAVGMVAGPRVMKACIEQAKVSGACFASVHNACHYGLGAYYPMMAAKENMIGFSIANTPALVAPLGGADPILGTNPISIAIPSSDKYPDLVLDIATSVTAKGRISLALKEGESIPLGWALDPEGRPTTDPAAANKGVLLPFGAHKGYGLSVIVSVLAGALSGAAMEVDLPRFFEEPEKMTNVGWFMGAIDISKFTDVDAFKKRAELIYDALKGCRLSEGSSAVFIPGEIEAVKTPKVIEEGIDLSEATLNDFKEMAETFGVEYTF